MKKLLVLFAGTLFLFTSCSQCYECSYDVEIEQNGQIVTEEVTDDICTASADEISAKEAEGYDCVASVGI